MVEDLPSWMDTDPALWKPFAEIRLIVADLDGTLLAYGSPRMRPLREWRGKLDRVGTDFTLATGRTLSGIRPLLDSLDFKPGIPVVLYNGSIAVEPPTFRTMYQRTLDADAVRTIVGACERVDMLVYGYRVDEMARRPGEDIERVDGWGRQPRPTKEFNGMPVRWRDDRPTKDEPPYAAVVVDATRQVEAMPSIAAQLGALGTATVTPSKLPFLEVRPASSTKATALAAVAKRLGIPAKAVLAIGDNDNDAEMLAWAGIGVCANAASPAARAAARYACRHGVETGVIEVMRLVREARRLLRPRYSSNAQVGDSLGKDESQKTRRVHGTSRD